MFNFNDPKLTFDHDKHLYFYDGVIVPNTTRLLQDYGLIDFSHVPLARLNYKRDLGTAVHYACFLLDENNLDESTLHPEIVPYVNAYKKFMEITGFEPRFSELKLYSKKWRFATTLDRQGPFEWERKEQESVIELKCTWEMYPSTGPQTASHKIVVEENFPEIKIKKRFGLQLKENGNYEIHPLTDPQDENTFLACVVLHHWRERNGLIRPEREN